LRIGKQKEISNIKQIKEAKIYGNQCNNQRSGFIRSNHQFSKRYQRKRCSTYDSCSITAYSEHTGSAGNSYTADGGFSDYTYYCPGYTGTTAYTYYRTSYTGTTAYTYYCPGCTGTTAHSGNG
jgi:hypothetical protein